MKGQSMFVQLRSPKWIVRSPIALDLWERIWRFGCRLGVASAIILCRLCRKVFDNNSFIKLVLFLHYKKSSVILDLWNIIIYIYNYLTVKRHNHQCSLLSLKRVGWGFLSKKMMKIRATTFLLILEKLYCTCTTLAILYLISLLSKSFLFLSL